ncbi:hypothetical protein FACS189418_5730 [Clostridia bacterium]|nr:hypothetical protein FACS189418_5730 [Clostridia bacterium]
MNFNNLFKQISPEEVCDQYNVCTLFGKDCYAVTAGREDQYNSMVGSGGGLVIQFKKPATWCIFQSDRYTLELIRKEQSYTLSFFPDKYKEQLMFLGSKSGRDSNKMQETALTGIQTPSGNMAFSEAKLIIECKLTQSTLAKPEDFYSPQAIAYLKEAYQEVNDYRQYVFGEIIHVWVNNIKVSLLVNG